MDIIDLQDRQRKTQREMNDLESLLETQKQTVSVEIQKAEKGGDEGKKHLADMFSRLEKMETRIQQVTGLSEEDRYHFQQITGGLKNLEQSLQKKLAPMEQQIRSLESQMKTVLESYQGLILQMQNIASLQKSAMERLAKVEGDIKLKSTPPVQARVPEAPQEMKQPVPVPQEPGPVEMYEKAMEKSREGDYESARSMFKEFLGKYPKEDLASNAQYWIGETYYAQGKFEEAILQFDKVIQLYPKSDKAPGAILKEAMSFCNLGDKEGCRLFLNKVIQDFPRSSEAEKAQQELKKLN